MEYITPAQMREAELRAASYGVTVETLMENAGRGVAEAVVSRFGPLHGKSVVVVCGSGNNGGDGLVAARYLSEVCSVDILLLSREEAIKTEEARRNWERALKAGLKAHVTPDVLSLESCAGIIGGAEVIIDAIFGTGVRGEVREPMARAISLINSSRARKVSVDIPSGLDPETGSAGSAVVRADVTATLHRAKTGLRGMAEYTGEVVVIPIGIRG